MVTPLFTRQTFNFDINNSGDLLVVGLPYADIASGTTPNRQPQRQENGGFITFTDRPSGDSVTGSGFISSSYFRNNLDTSTTPTSGSSFGHSVSLNGKGDRLAVIADPNIFGSGLFHVFESGSNNLGSCLYPSPWVDISISGVSGVRIPSPHSAIQLDSSGNSLITYRSKFQDYDEYVSTDKIYRYEYRYETCSSDYTWYRTSIIAKHENDTYDRIALGSQAAFSGSGYRVAATYNAPSFENSSGTFHQYGDVFLVYNKAGSGTSFTGFEGEPTINCDNWVYEGDCLTRMPYSIYNSGQLCTSVTCVPAGFDSDIADPPYPTTTSTSTTLSPSITTTSTTASPATTTTTTSEDLNSPKGACCYKDDTITNHCVYVTEQQCDYIAALPDVIGDTSWQQAVTCDPDPCNFDQGCCDWNGVATVSLRDGGADCIVNQEVQFTPCAGVSNCWEYNDDVACGDNVSLKVTCDTSITDINDVNKWSLVQFDRNCVNTETIRPDSNINTLWHESNYVYIIDSNDSNYAKADNRDESEKQKWGFEALSTLTSIGSVEVYVRHKTDGPERTDPIVNVKIGGSWRTGQSISQESDFTSVSKIWRGSWTASDFDNFEVGITAPDDMHKQAEFQVAEVYAVVGGPVTPSVTGVVTYEGLCNTPPLFYGIWGDSSNCDCCQ